VNKESVIERVEYGNRFCISYVLSKLADEYAGLVESEIELMLLLAFLAYDFGCNVKTFKVIKQDDPIKDGFLSVVPQYVWENSRIDFCLLGKDSPEAPIERVFVECDGHEFHERTREQAQRDRAKDRAAQGAGIPILRFTGSEIYRNPTDCLAQIMTFILNRQTKVANG